MTTENLVVPQKVCLKQLVANAAESIRTKLKSLTGLDADQHVLFEWPQNDRDGGAKVKVGGCTFWLHVTMSENLERAFNDQGDSWAKLQQSTKSRRVKHTKGTRKSSSVVDAKLEDFE